MRKFGIELEMVAPAGQSPLAHANATVRTTGIEMRNNSHFGREYEVWQAKPDGSIQPYDRGVEVVSRILPGREESYNEITLAVGALETARFGVNRSCGFHVHVNVSDLPMRVRQLSVLRYAQLQPQINAMLPPSRRNNNFCQPLGSAVFQSLAGNIDRNQDGFPISGRYSATNVAWISAQGDDARIEFRQAAATCNPGKVIGWVRFLQEMIDEVARRAVGITFGAVPVPPPVAPPRPVLVPQTIGGRVPTMRRGSDADRAMDQLCQHGVITAQWAQANGIADNVLRRIMTGFRRHGAGLITQRSDAGPVYLLAGAHALPIARERVFAASTVTMPAVVIPTPAPAPVVQPARIMARDFIAYDFAAGLSVETLAWCNDRRDTFQSSDEPNAVRAA